MRSLRTRITLMTACAIIVSMLVAMVLGVTALRTIGQRNANQTLLLLCEAGEKNLDLYFDRVEQSVEMVSAYVQSDLDGLEDAQLQAHLDRVSDIFKRLTYNTSGILTYYYRIDPEISTAVRGFWYVHWEDDGFREHEVTDITQYDTGDTSRLVWFTVPKATGKPVWLPPYVTENLDARVISYNVPVYFRDRFVGVIGIELDYTTIAEQVNNITLFQNGYAFVNDPEGNIVYHPRMDVMTMETPPRTPEGIVSENSFIHYTFDGVEKQAVWLPLVNGARLNVTAPVSEINAEWQRLALKIVLAFSALLVVGVALAMRFAGRITRPLQALTRVAEQVNEGNYDCDIPYDGQDEVGVLARTFTRLTDHLKTYIGDLNNLAYADSLTSLHNKGAFDLCLHDLEADMEAGNAAPEFAVCIFDCNDLKKVNDRYGHEKGDIYLREAAAVICEVYDHSPVFRIGGDEFAAVLRNLDYRDRDDLLSYFDACCARKYIEEIDTWHQMSIARGMAIYNPAEDGSVHDVVRRADKLMYENKWYIKYGQADKG